LEIIIYLPAILAPKATPIPQTEFGCAAMAPAQRVP